MRQRRAATIILRSRSPPLIQIAAPPRFLIVALQQAFLDRFAAQLPQRTHAALLLDGAAWHTALDLKVPANVSLIRLPPYSPQLNPVERVWLYLRERFLSLRLFDDLGAIVDGCCDAWNRLANEPGRLASLTDYPYLRKVRNS